MARGEVRRKNHCRNFSVAVSGRAKLIVQLTVC